MAKRWIRRGLEITGAPIKQVLDRQVSFMDIASVICDIEARWLHGDYTMASPGMIRELYASLATEANWSRIAEKTYRLCLHPLATDSERTLMTKCLSFWERFPPYLGCNKI